MGFRREMITIDNEYVLNYLLNKLRKEKRRIVALFTDLKNLLLM